MEGAGREKEEEGQREKGEREDSWGGGDRFSGERCSHKGSMES